jgi:hypothetical protein
MKQASRTHASQVSRINPVPDDPTAGLVGPDTLADLAEQIMATTGDQPTPATPPGRRTSTRRTSTRRTSTRRTSTRRTSTRRTGTRRARVRRRVLIGIPATAAIAAAAVAVTVIAHPGQKVGPVTVGPPSAQALSFTRDGRYIDVIVRNPGADEATYRTEFAAHHMHITLTLVPVPKDMAGTLVYMGTPNNGGGIIVITAKGRCTTGSGSNECPVGVKVPIDFHGRAQFTFGRAARPGEQYESTNSQTSPGEPLHGLRNGERVAAALAFLHSRHERVYQYRYLGPGGLCPGNLTGPVPAGWVVQMFVPWSSDQVLLWVGPTSGPKRNCSLGSAAVPRPSASPAGG